jgi:phosphoglycerate dehydrogenase-like enzyme
MKSIFLGDANAVKRVYSPSVIKELEEIAELYSEKVYKKEDLTSGAFSAKDVQFIFTTWGMPAFTADEIKSLLPSLKAVFYGAGSVQGFARQFLECGIKVFSAWAANGVPVAEYTLAQILLANKGFYQSTHFKTREERHKAAIFSGSFPGNFNCKVGIIGAGMIGSMVIELLKRHKIETLVFDPFLSDERANTMGVEKCSLEKVFGECQTISNHLANNPQTVGMLNFNLFKLMKKNATFINTGRGAQVVEDDLVKILRENPDMTAILDVTYPEHPENGHPFYSLNNVFLTPHIAGSSGNVL